MEDDEGRPPPDATRTGCFLRRIDTRLEQLLKRRDA
jgi:hypothetical protein